MKIDMNRIAGSLDRIEERLAGVQGSLANRLAAVEAKLGGGPKEGDAGEVVSGGRERVVELVTSVEKGGKVVKDTVITVADLFGRRRVLSPRKPEARRLTPEEVQALILRDAMNGTLERRNDVVTVGWKDLL